MWKIGDVLINGRVVLAPMAGVSNPSYMKICEEMGISYVVTELISSEAVVRDNKKTLEMLKGIEDLNIPYAIQIFGNNPDTMAEAAKKIVSIYPKAIIDINMGCPVPKVAIRSESGSALLKNPEKIREIVTKVVNAIDNPVTVKIRSGWDKDSINAKEVAKICEKAGAKAIAIHARTRSQGYSGLSDWSVIKDVVDAVNIPVIGNGDITTRELAKKMIDETGCTAVMIGRAALGNPWLLKMANDYIENSGAEYDVTPKEKIEMIKKHYNLLLKYKNEKLALLEIRSHAIWYLKGLKGCADIKNAICQAKSKEEILKILDDYDTCL